MPESDPLPPAGWEGGGGSPVTYSRVWGAYRLSAMDWSAGLWLPWAQTTDDAPYARMEGSPVATLADAGLIALIADGPSRQSYVLTRAGRALLEDSNAD